MTAPTIDPSEFVATVEPLLERQDAPGLLTLLRTRWTHDQIKSILSGDDLDARKVACLALGLTGSKCSIPCIAQQLRHPDPVINQMAEHALWSIWFRAGSASANHELCRGSQALSRRDLDCAIEHFTRAIEIDPAFAEPYNQRGIAKYLGERYSECAADCMEAVQRMPCHFGAWAGAGHCHAHKGHLAEAVKCYERALEINPHLDIRHVVCQLKQEIRRSP